MKISAVWVITCEQYVAEMFIIFLIIYCQLCVNFQIQNMALLPPNSSEMTKSKKPGMRMEKCLFGQQELDIPEIMMEDVRFF